jgi:3'(2'), 5'-bisphosphate nucleotidase
MAVVMPEMNDRELSEVLRIAREAAVRVRAIYATPFTVEMKGPNDPVTIADRQANELICEALTASFPGDAILAEESVPDSRGEVARRARAPRVWYVDPLDGTREFADKNGEFAVMIGLAEQGCATLGVLVLPATGEALAGRVGAGAFVEPEGGARRPVVVSPIADPALATLVTSRSHTPATIGAFARLVGIGRVVPCGSVGVKVARLVLGDAHLYVHGGPGAKLWDTCAPEAVLVAAGGRFTDLDGAPIDYASPELGLPNGLIASNGPLHAAALAAVKATRDAGP